jgi:hypothetical protein
VARVSTFNSLPLMDLLAPDMAASLNSIQSFACSLGRVRIHHKPSEISAERRVTRAPAQSGMMPPSKLQLRHP